MIGEADYRNVTTAVRTPRLAVLIDENNPYWRNAVASLTRIFSRTWGGKYFLIMPTDGKRIKDKFWELLEAYSPDYLGAYELTLADLSEADPKRYETEVERWRHGWTFDQDFDEWFEEQQYHVTVGEFKVDPILRDELKNRLAPYHHGEHVVQEQLLRNHPIGFPFTKVSDVSPYARTPVKKLVLARPMADPDLMMLVLSQAGDLDEASLGEFRAQDVAITTLPTEYATEDLVESVMRGFVDETELRLKKALADELDDGTWRPDEDYVVHMPFQASMLHLARYYRIDRHRDWEEPVTVIVGDSIEDFCLYYCLSRLHDGVIWLPQKWLEESERRRANNVRLRKRGRPTIDVSEPARVAAALVRLLYKMIRLGHDKRIEVRSMSISAADLKRSVSMMDKIHWGAPSEFTESTTIREVSDASAACIARVIETNNYMNQQEMVFIGGKSVSRLATPKPRNFSPINPMVHRWLTSVDISGYAPPLMPTLGGQIVLAHEARVDADGVVYLCPGVMTSGTEIDPNLIRPHLAIVPARDIIRQYFGQAGLELRPSDKGNYVSDTIDRFGGLSEAAAFMGASNTRAILDLFLTKQSAQDGHVVYLTAEGGRAFVNYDGVRACMNDGAAELIDDLVSKEIFQRGLIFLCTRCRLSSWYDLADLTTEFVCRRCSQRQQFTRANWKSPVEPRWYYTLAETVYQCYTHDSDLTILTLNYLKTQAERSFEYLPEVDVIDFPAQGDKHEIDVACLVDNRIVLGECKTEALRPSHTTKYEDLADALGRRPDQIVFATSRDAVSESFQTKLRGLRGGTILTAKDLLP